jgi:hypothetical protein
MLRPKLFALFVVSVLLLGASACGEDEPSLQDAPPTGVTPSPTILNPEFATVLPPPPSPPTPVVVPPDWLSFTYPAVGDFTFRYPSNWFLGVGGQRLSSFDPSSAPNVHYFPPSGVAVEVGRVPLDSPGIAPRPEGAVDTTLDSAPGWEIVFTYEGADVVRRIHTVQVDHNGHRYYVLGYFGQPDADERVFLEVLSTFQFVASGG